MVARSLDMGKVTGSNPVLGNFYCPLASKLLCLRQDLKGGALCEFLRSKRRTSRARPAEKFRQKFYRKANPVLGTIKKIKHKKPPQNLKGFIFFTNKLLPFFIFPNGNHQPYGKQTKCHNYPEGKRMTLHRNFNVHGKCANHKCRYHNTDSNIV